MKGKQLAMDSALEDLDRYELEREKRKTESVKAMLDTKYRRANANELRELPAGSVIIIGQSLFRKNHYAWHFYRTVMNFSRSCADPHKPIFVQASSIGNMKVKQHSVKGRVPSSIQSSSRSRFSSARP